MPDQAPSPLLSLTPEWVKDAIFYQIFPDRFAHSGHIEGLNLQPWGSAPTFHGYMGGDLWGVIEQLDHIQSLGANAIYFCPVFQSASNHRYHTHDYYKVDPMLGGNQALYALIDAAHERGMRVILDGVFNHASRGFFQFNDLLEQGEESAYRDWFHVEGWPLHAYDEEHPANYKAWWGLRALPKFNTNHPAVREYLWSVGEYWVQQGIDGWRLDVPNEIDDDEFWREFRRRVKAANPEAYIVGEIWGDAERWLQGDQFDAVMNYHFSRPCMAFFGGQTLNHEMNERSGIGHLDPIDAATFGERMAYLTKVHHPDIVRVQLNLLDSHDTARFLSATCEDATAFRLATIFQMTYVGAPCIYYGDEIGLRGGPDPDCRRAFPWNQDEWDHDTLGLIRKLTTARRSVPALGRGDFRVLHAQGEELTYVNEHASGNAYILMNVSREERHVPLPEAQAGRYRDVIGGQQYDLTSEPSVLTVPARSALVLVRV